uniref:Coiled-coil domain-containing protein 93 n=1 Tax=Callorhinchus milii TaxID=7868 RepID=A0A4W3HFL3_CALMI
MAAASVFQRLRSGSRLGPQYDQEGNVIEVETREDEEQNVKLAEILELLVAAGYFRARIKGLSPFDKVVGGMTWCITTCSFDIDVDLLFQENSTIGQKIALTEKIVSVLPNMKCPHRLEPHQIQGLDFIHIFPVVQWLVKRAIETREEMGDYIRSFSVSQFQKNHSLLEDNDFKQRKSKAMKAVVDVSDVYKPQRKYKRLSGAQTLIDEESRVHSTLLEFDKKVTLAAGMTEVSEEEDLQAAEEGRLTASTVGQIVGLQSEEIKQIASEYAGKQNELSTEDHPERFGVAQQHRRQVASLSKQILQKSKQLEECHCYILLTSSGLFQIVRHGEKLDKELSALEVAESQADSGLLEKLRALVTMNEDLKSQEQEFRTHCREEMARLQQQIESLKAETGNDESAEKVSMLISKARRNREIAILQRKIDEVPSRVELTQYQRRFVELYSQVAATHKETKQFFTLYNTLDDKKVYLEKEVSLLNSIHDNFQLAMASPAAREQFLRQMEQIVEGIKQNRMKLEKKKQENKMRRDQLNDEYLELLEKQRLYFKTVKEFKEECRKNEILLTKLRTKGIS